MRLLTMIDNLDWFSGQFFREDIYLGGVSINKKYSHFHICFYKQHRPFKVFDIDELDFNFIIDYFIENILD